MRITNMKVNHIEKPLGFTLDLNGQKPVFSWTVCECVGKKQEFAQLIIAKDEKLQSIIFDSGKSKDVDGVSYAVAMELEPCTRYYWQASVWTDSGEIASGISWFETAKQDTHWLGKWITHNFEVEDSASIHSVLEKKVLLTGEVLRARAYVCGLGLYEFYINGKKAGNEYLTPGYNAYDKWIQYQTYDITQLLTSGENSFGAMLGDGWYKGRFSLNGQNERNIYGDKMAFLCEIVIEYANGDKTIVVSDEGFSAYRSPVIESGIYDGEKYDANILLPWDEGFDGKPFSCNVIDLGFEKLTARLSPPMLKMHEISTVDVLITPSGETVLDMGQNMTGWLEFDIQAPKNTEILFQFGEILYKENFFRDNLRGAKAEYRYISDGKPKTGVRPHFTYYGFRYVKITGWHGVINKENFRGSVIYSDVKQTGFFETSSELVNKLFTNAMWGQRGNFLDVPTDCPQRDERMGWTGDAQVFCGTACYNTDSYAFFSKYGYDMYKEQLSRDGAVPHVIPASSYGDTGSCAWSDAAAIMPWTIYVHYGDKTILEQQFDSMKSWADYMRRQDEASGGKRLRTVGFHFGDWLSLDKVDTSNCIGGTDVYYLASAFYRYSTLLVSKAARVLGKIDIADEYAKLSEEIKNAIQEEYITKSGRISSDTQTAYVVALWLDLYASGQRQKMVEMLAEKIKAANNKLTTGFVGTAYLCRVLSEFGLNDVAYTLLLNEEYPGWLFSVKNGATTIWERWDSYKPDGKLGDLGMNSFNHYAFGSIAEWMYRNIAGINPVEEKPGFKHAVIRPRPDSRLSYAKGKVHTPCGLYKSEWKILTDGKYQFNIEIPFNCTADIILPDNSERTLGAGKYEFKI